MERLMEKASFFLALLFSPFASALAFGITYSEFIKHFVDRKRARRKALGVALGTFIFFSIVPPLLILIFKI
jgi:hypothetical protein